MGPLEVAHSNADSLNRKPSNFKTSGQGARYFSLLCPCHNDTSPSASVTEGDSRALVFHCFAGCNDDDIEAALDTHNDWFGQRHGGRNGASVIQPVHPPQPTIVTESKIYSDGQLPSGHNVRAHKYFNKDGSLAQIVFITTKPNGKKSVLPVTPFTDGLWKGRSCEAPRPLYNLKEITESDPNKPIVVLEGEKDCDTWTVYGHKGLVPIAHSGGSSSASKTDWSPVNGRKIIIVTDADIPSHKWADKLANDLSLNYSCKVVLAKLPDYKRSSECKNPETCVMCTYCGTGRDWTNYVTDFGGKQAWLKIKDLCRPYKPDKSSVNKNNPDQDDDEDPKEDVLRATSSDISIAFVGQYEGTYLHDSDRSKWHKYDHGIWKIDSLNKTIYDIGNLCNSVPLDHLKPSRMMSERIRLQNHGFYRGTLAIAAANPRMAVKGSEYWDPNPFHLGVPGGYVDLETGRLCAARPENNITMSCSVAPSEKDECPVFDRFMDQITCGDKGMEEMLNQWCGYALTGMTKYQKFLFCWGVGGNGKTVWLSTLKDIMGDYASVAAPKLFEEQKFEGHTTSLAALQGKRMIMVSEVSKNAQWNMYRLTSMTGGDEVTARFMRQDDFTFRPKFKLIIIGNTMPTIRDPTEAVIRRLISTPFSLILNDKTKDNDLPDKLRLEHPAILRRFINSYKECAASGGIHIPASVRKFTDEYLAGEDTFKQFLGDNYTLTGGEFDKESISDIYHWYKRWHVKHDVPMPLSQQQLFRKLGAIPELSKAENVISIMEGGKCRPGFSGISKNTERGGSYGGQAEIDKTRQEYKERADKSEGLFDYQEDKIPF